MAKSGTLLKISDLRSKTSDQLSDMLKDLNKEALNLRFQKTTGELEKTHRFDEVRKTIARIKTLQNQENQGKAVVVKAAAKPDQASEAKAAKKAKKESGDK